MRRTVFEPEHEQFRSSVRRFMQIAVAPFAEDWRATEMVDRDHYA